MRPSNTEPLLRLNLEALDAETMQRAPGRGARADPVADRMTATDRRPPYRFAHRIRVGFDETDAQGVVYYGRYMPYFDRARVEYLRGLGILGHVAGEPEFAMRAQHVEYHAPARFDDELEVFVRARAAGHHEHHVGVRRLPRGERRAPCERHPGRRRDRPRASGGRCAIPDAVRAAVAGFEQEVEGVSPAADDYRGALAAIERIMNREADSDAIVRLTVEVLHDRLDTYSWVGIYFVEERRAGARAVEGPAARPSTCASPIGEGVCGAAASSGMTEIVADVAADPRYLACFPSTRSEIVVPVRYEGTVVAEIDIDSDTPAAFGAADREFLERVATVISPHCLVGWDTGGDRLGRPGELAVTAPLEARPRGVVELRHQRGSGVPARAEGEIDMADMAESGSGKRLFVRQSSGLVRDVSVTNALFFNVAAFVGVGLTLYPAFYSLAFEPVWRFGPVLRVRHRGDRHRALLHPARPDLRVAHVGHAPLRRRLRVHDPHRAGRSSAGSSRGRSSSPPSRSWPSRCRSCCATSRSRAGSSASAPAGTSSRTPTPGSPTRRGEITGWNGLIWSLVVLAVIAGIVLLPTRRFHKVVTIMAAIGVTSFVLMFVFGLLATSQSDFNRNLPQYTGGVHAAKIAASGSAILPGYTDNFLSDIFSRTVFPFMLGIVFLQFIGFQYSAYIAGEVRGNVKRGVSVALLGALSDRRHRQLALRRPVLEPHRLQHGHELGLQLLGRRHATSPCRSASRPRCRSWR